MKEITEFLDLVNQKWQQAFIQFVETGEAPPAFLYYLERDESAKLAVEMALVIADEKIRDVVSRGPAAAQR